MSKFISYPIFTLILLFIIIACTPQKNKENPERILSESRELFRNNEYEKALLKIDSICILYPDQSSVLFYAYQLTDSINRTLNQSKLDSLNNIKNKYVAQIYLLENNLKSADKKEELLNYYKDGILKIDSQRFIHRKIINSIIQKESLELARCQCRRIFDKK